MWTLMYFWRPWTFIHPISMGLVCGTSYQMIVRSCTSHGMYPSEKHSMLIDAPTGIWLKPFLTPCTLRSCWPPGMWPSISHGSPAASSARLVETDQRTVMGRILDTLCSQLNISDINLLTSTGLKNKLKYFETPAEEQWRLSMITELIKLSPWLHSRGNQCNVGLQMHNLGLLLSSS